ncbi:PEP-CTERM sorting domain-containing protein [Ruficoccus sp. ZRK36]|uniref:PEP-CTERM sorting domain-containing protein n=1 Tax=Ruficoccus sp. ZRK36 TaxID=2866311 RepID=UPI001C7321AD|nr:PEP-CTERM sorting domain-containing protein [Ruficoccus sp. ZRK36]QYY34517.1 PEP-CTERM sorting domain-containing protein [Ruficoccus sp. ZRK36]
MQIPHKMHLALSFCSLVLAAGTVSAAVVTDLPLAEGPGTVIAPTRSITLEATGSTSSATLNARSDIYALQSVPGFSSSGLTNIVSYTDSTLPDLRYTKSFSGTNTGNEITNPGFLTSSTPDTATNSGYYIYLPTNATEALTPTITIDFGSYNSGTEEFTTGVNSVQAAGFTLTAPAARFALTSSIVVEFLDASSGVLSSQTVLYSELDTDDPNDPNALYFGYESDDYDIASISITFNQDAGTSVVPIIGLDDVAFTSVPEPSTMGMLGLGLLALIGLRLRRR